jgi:hypothetical protein
MGLTYTNIAVMAAARAGGVDFERVLTIGRQSLFLTESHIRRLARHYGVSIDPSRYPWHGPAEPFIRDFFGASEVVATDVSDYEGAAIVHDMNAPLAIDYHESFDVVIDGGSLEHVFNVPVALANYMNAVRVGGSLFVITTANNHLGHGFYQFSPELLYRVFSESNGYAVRDMILEEHPWPGVELSGRNRCYRVADPAQVGERVGLISRGAVILTVHAVRESSRPVLASFPIQSDYAGMHEAGAAGASAAADAVGPGADLATNPGSARRSLGSRLPRWLRNWIVGWMARRRYSFGNRRFFEPWDLP